MIGKPKVEYSKRQSKFYDNSMTAIETLLKDRWEMKFTKLGGRRAALKGVKARIAMLLGKYGDRDVSWGRVERIVFVCQGNICRSAYAEGVAKRAGLNAISCGLGAYGQAEADGLALRVALDKGVDLAAHISTNIREVSPSENDLFVVMEPAQLLPVTEYCEAVRSQVVLLGLIGGGRRPYLPDPYGKSEEFFNICFNWIDDHIDLLVKEMKGGQAVIESSRD